MLSVRAEPDPTRPIGYARIVLQGLQQPPADAKFCIRREGYPEPNLGLRGWQVREERLAPVQVAAEGSGTVLVVGPAVTKHLEPAPFVFAVPGAGIEEPLFWPDTIDVFEGELPPETPAPAPEPAEALVARSAAPAPPPPPKPAPPFEAAPPPPPPPPPPVREIPAPPTTPAPGAEAGRSRMPLLLGLGALLLVAIGGGAWWFLSREQPRQQETVERNQTQEQSDRTRTPPPPPPASPPWPEGTDELTLRDLVERAPDAAGIHAAALRRQAANRHDDALVLFEEAGDRGYAASLTALARLYDPNGFVPNRPFRNPDPRAAARYYRDAVQKGDAGAAAPREALRRWLEERSRAGNSTAESALREFWP